MPTRVYNEKQRAKEAAAIDVKVFVNLRPYNVVYQIFVSQLAVLPYFTAYIASLVPADPQLHLDGFHPALFDFLFQWLADGTIWPLRDHTAASSAPDFAASFLDITFAKLFDISDDSDPFLMPTTRKLIEAYFMGQRIGAHHFMDAIMNLITSRLRMESPPFPIYVFQVYSRSTTGLHGLKKLLVDAWIWADRVSHGQVPRLSDYLPEFQQQVNATMRQIQTRKYAFDSINPANPRNSETVDVEINFHALENCLCNGSQGRLKCRYHVHPATEPCWNLIVDNTPVTEPPALRPVASHRHLAGSASMSDL